MIQPFDPCKPATTIADSDDWALYKQQGRCWLYSHGSDTARAVSEPPSWLTRLEMLQYAVREAEEA